MEGPRDEWRATDVWAESDISTPQDTEEDQDEEYSMSVDAVEYQKRIREVLNGTQTPRQGPDEVEEEGIGVEPMLEKMGIGEEEFGIQSPRSSVPSTPTKTPRQLSYIRECCIPCLV